jgi:hypothetical protein
MKPLVLTAALVLGQLPSIPAQQAARARVEGVVLRAGSNEPVVGARVTLARPGELNVSTSISTTGAGNSINLFQVPPVPTTNPSTNVPAVPPLPIPPVLTDNAGKFVFSEVDPGTFRLLVYQDGFVRQEYGQRLSSGQGTPLTIHAGDVLKDMTIRLVPTGNIGGRIVDNLGKPAVGVPLLLLRAAYNPVGQRMFQQGGSARTNDRGEYRFYWVTPGRYYIAGGTPQGVSGPGGGTASSNESGDSYTFTYYPGVVDTSRAIAVEVRPGGEFVADFVVPKQQLYAIRGRIVDSAAPGPPASASVALAYQQITGPNTMYSRNPIYDPATGAFELRDVLPGPYIVYANTQGGSARSPVEVVNANIEGVILAVNGGINISGRISVESGRLPSSGLRVQLRPIVAGSSSFFGNFPSSQTISPEGTFAINNVLPGQYQIIPPSVSDFYVKQMRYDRLDALNQAVDVVQRGQDAPTLDVVLSPNVSQIEGVVSSSGNTPASGVSVVLIPDTGRDRFELYKTATSDQAGAFTIRSIAPGNYKLFAWEDLEPNGYFDPDLLRRSERLGQAVRVEESSKQAVTVQMIPANF